MKAWLLILCALPFPLFADDVYTKDGKVHRGLALRLESGIVFGKHLAPKDPQTQDVLIVANQIERIVFQEPPALQEMRQAAYSGDANAVLEKNAQLIADHRPWAEFAGNYWKDLMRAQVQALVASGKNEELQKLIQSWVPTGDGDLEDCVKLLSLRSSASDKNTFLDICKKATAGSPATLVAAISWLELGHAAMANKQWALAVRHYLSVQVFASPWRLLLPEALLGATRACASNHQAAQAAVYAQDLRNEYAQSEQATKINAALSGNR